MSKRIVYRVTFFTFLVGTLAMISSVSATASSLSTTVRATKDMKSNAAFTYVSKSTPHSMTADGRTTVFASNSDELTPGDTNAVADIFAYDRITDKVELITRGLDGASTTGPSFTPTISPDGRYIAFISNARNLIPGPPICGSDLYCPNLFIYDRTTKQHVMANKNTLGLRVPLDWSYIGNDPPVLSDNGRCVTFVTTHSVTPNDTNGDVDVLVRDMRANVTSLVSADDTGKAPEDGGMNASISRDSRYVTFVTASRLVAADRNNEEDVYLRDRQLGTTSLMSGSKAGQPGSGASFDSALSGDGSFVAFASTSNNLVDGDTNFQSDIFLRDVRAGTTRRISVTSRGVQANDSSFAPDISGDGRYVVYSSGASNLVGGDGNEQYDIFLYDCATGVTRRVNVASHNGVPAAGGGSFQPSISGDGKAITFTSDAINLTQSKYNIPLDQLYVTYNPVVGIPYYDSSDVLNIMR